MLRRPMFVVPVLLVGCFAPPPVEGDESEIREELSGRYQTPLAESPCPDETDEAASARRAIAKVRALGGLPALRCDASASRAAAAHCEYVAANGGVLTHVQTRGRAKFTGVTFQDRLAAASFADSPACEVLANIHGSDSVLGHSGYLNSVYHRACFLRTETVSFGYGSADACSAIDFGRVHNLASVRDVVVVWPPDGARGVPFEFYASRETPNPVPGRSIVGSPISLIRATGLGPVKVTLIGPTGVVPTVLLTHASDPAKLVRPGEAHAIPIEPLLPRTAYTARFAMNGQVIGHTTFTTASSSE